MAKLSRQIKEVIKTVLVLIIIALLFTAYVIYPLNKSKKMFSREDVEEFNYDTLPPNDLGPYADSSLVVDSFRIEPDGLTSLACLQVREPAVDSFKGTIVLLHEKSYNRNDYFDYVKAFADLDYNIIIYDQRASGLSSGKYFGFGIQEATDLEELISTLVIRDKIIQPIYVVGFGFGADAALWAATEEHRITKVVAINPYITTDRAIDKLRENYQSYWFPFYRTIMFWWYKIRSGYAPIYIEHNDIKPVACKTLLIVGDKARENEDVSYLIESSDKNKLTVKPRAADQAELIKEITGFIEQQ